MDAIDRLRQRMNEARLRWKYRGGWPSAVDEGNEDWFTKVMRSTSNERKLSPRQLALAELASLLAEEFNLEPPAIDVKKIGDRRGYLSRSLTTVGIGRVEQVSGDLLGLVNWSDADPKPVIVVAHDDIDGNAWAVRRWPLPHILCQTTWSDARSGAAAALVYEAMVAADYQVRGGKVSDPAERLERACNVTGYDAADLPTSLRSLFGVA